MQKQLDENRKRSRRAFTLVELLVVIAIISVLAALLMPALSSVMSISRRVTCMNNMKQMYLGIILYSEDYKSLPTDDHTYFTHKVAKTGEHIQGSPTFLNTLLWGPCSPNKSFVPMHWRNNDRGYLEDYGVFFCPEYYSKFAASNQNNQWQTYKDPMERMFHFWYGKNSYQSYMCTWEGASENRPATGGKKINARHPGRCWLLSDYHGMNYQRKMTIRTHSFAEEMLNRINVLHLDGHVDTHNYLYDIKINLNIDTEDDVW